MPRRISRGPAKSRYADRMVSAGLLLLKNHKNDRRVIMAAPNQYRALELIEPIEIIDVKQVSLSDKYSWSWHGRVVGRATFHHLPPSTHANSTNICPIRSLVRSQTNFSMSSISLTCPILIWRSRAYSAAVFADLTPNITVSSPIPCGISIFWHPKSRRAMG